MRFGRIENCGLAKATAERGTEFIPYTPEDYKTRCNFSACEACSLENARRFARVHEFKGAVMKDEPYVALLTWPLLPVCSISIDGVFAFLYAFQKLRKRLSKETGQFGGIALAIAVVHYNLVTEAQDGLFQPHVHIAVIVGERTKEEVHKALRRAWKKLGGKGVLLRKKKSTLGSFIYYVLKNPPVQGFSDDGRMNFHNWVLKAVERRSGKTTTPRFAVGPLSTTQSVRRLVAREEHERKAKEEGHLSLDDPNRKAANYMSSVRNVCPAQRCPRCKKAGDRWIKKNGTTSGGKQRWRCKNCGKSWSVKQSLYAPKFIPNSRIPRTEATLIYRLYLKGGNISEVVRKTGATRYRVRQILHSKRRQILRSSIRLFKRLPLLMAGTLMHIELAGFPTGKSSIWNKVLRTISRIISLLDQLQRVTPKEPLKNRQNRLISLPDIINRRPSPLTPEATPFDLNPYSQSLKGITSRPLGRVV